MTTKARAREDAAFMRSWTAIRGTDSWRPPGPHPWHHRLRLRLLGYRGRVVTAIAVLRGTHECHEDSGDDIYDPDWVWQ